ncbi:MAG: hypothetical protein FWD16_00085 [Clostridia bacterium]|nr:hypothetical protein [Clostridia bacterium]
MNTHDLNIIRDLARQIAELAAHPQEAAKAEKWQRHNDLLTDEPMVFADPEGGWAEIITPGDLLCQEEEARAWERKFRCKIFQNKYIRDDHVVDDLIYVDYVLDSTGWGLAMDQHTPESVNRGAYKVLPSLADYDRDLPRLHFPQFTLDKEASASKLAQTQEIFRDILTVKQVRQTWWSFGMTNLFITFRGLDNLLCDFYDEPENVHKTMELFCNGYSDTLDWYEQNGLLYQNTGNHYVGSGGFGFTKQLPPPASGKITTRDMWASSESQETVGVSPEMFGEFIFPYQLRLVSRFGLNCYGCCEPVDQRWEYIRQIPNLRRVSVSPWSSKPFMAEALGRKYIMSVKPNPARLATYNMDEAGVRADLREALDAGRANGCIVELMMKDNHSLGGNPNNIVRWVEIAREEIGR